MTPNDLHSDASQSEVALLRQRIEELEARLRAAEETSATLSEQLQIFQALAANAPDAISIYDQAAHVRYVNQAMLRQMGVASQDEVVGRPVSALLPKEEFARLDREMRESLERSGQWSGRVWSTRPDGSRWLASNTSFLLRTPEGRTLGLAMFTRDVTSQHDAEEELRTFKAVIDNSPDGIFIGMPDDTIVYANRASQKLFGYGEALVGMKGAQLYDPSVAGAAQSAMAELFEQGTWMGLMTARRQDGSTFPMQVSAVLIRNEAGEPTATAAIVRDVTEQRRAEEEQLALQEQVIEAQRAALREVSTPLIPLADEVVVMPLVGAIDTARAQQIMETLLEGIVEYQADVAIIDITGVKVVDTQVADALLRTAQAVKLLGAHVVLTGIGAEIAQALVHLGADLSGIVTLSNLQSGIAYALEQRG